MSLFQFGFERRKCPSALAETSVRRERPVKEEEEKEELEEVKFSSLSAPTKIEELTAGSDEKTQRSPAGN